MYRHFEMWNQYVTKKSLLTAISKTSEQKKLFSPLLEIGSSNPVLIWYQNPDELLNPKFAPKLHKAVKTVAFIVVNPHCSTRQPKSIIQHNVALTEHRRSAKSQTKTKPNLHQSPCDDVYFGHLNNFFIPDNIRGSSTMWQTKSLRGSSGQDLRLFTLLPFCKQTALHEQKSTRTKVMTICNRNGYQPASSRARNFGIRRCLQNQRCATLAFASNGAANHATSVTEPVCDTTRYISVIPNVARPQIASRSLRPPGACKWCFEITKYCVRRSKTHSWVLGLYLTIDTIIKTPNTRTQ